MATPAEKLAQSLSVLLKLQNDGHLAINTNSLSRRHRERLVKHGFLKEVIKGWYISSRPGEPTGESTAWYTSFWSFCKGYLDQRFDSEWYLSPEQSLLLHAENWTTPSQLLVRTPKGNNTITHLPHDTSLVDARSPLPDPNFLTEKNGLKLFSLPAALVYCSPKFFVQFPNDARIVLSMVTDASEILRILLDGGHSSIASRLAGAFRNIHNDHIADTIIKTMLAADYDVREKDPFVAETPSLFYSKERSPYVNRMKMMWHDMRPKIIEHFPNPPNSSFNKKAYLKQVEEIYVTDAYHSLSIEGYQVSLELIEKVRSGKWNPENNEDDRISYNALAARGYWLAFQAVKQSVKKVLHQANPGEVAKEDHGNWYLEMFKPGVTAGLLKPSDLAGYRNSPVYIRHSKHVPPNCNAVRDLMPAFFELLTTEKNAAVRVVLGHFFFVYIHPYMDGNGRIGRFLMNVMLAAGGYPWTVIPVEQRKQYFLSLEAASVTQDIVPFCKFLAKLVGGKSQI